MFEGDLSELDTRTLLSAGAEFRAVEDRAAVRQLEVALAFADRYPDPRGEAGAGYGSGYDEALPGGGERGRVYGGVGCPAVAEFAVAEFAAVFGWSTGAGAAFIGEALALRHRFPRIWAKVLAGEAVPWRARQVARMCLALSVDAAAIVDKRVVGVINSVGLDRLRKIVKAAIFEADPEGARAAAEAAARKRGVFVGESDEHGTKTIWVMAAAGDVIRFDATIDDLARALRTLGDPDSLDLRRAKAIGWIADPASAHQLLEAARLIAATHRDGTDHTSTDRAGAESATAESATVESATVEGASAESATVEGASADGAGAEGTSTDGAGAESATVEGASADGADTTGTSRGGTDSAGDRAGRAGDRDHGHRDTGTRAAEAATTTGADPAAADTPADAHASTDPAAPCSAQSRPADHADTADTDAHAESESGEGRAGDEAERAGDLAADPPTDLATDVADWAEDWPEGWVPAEEPGPDDEADRDTPHPSNSDHLDNLDALDTADLLDIMADLAWRQRARNDDPDTDPVADLGTRRGTGAATGVGVPDPFSRQALAGKLAAIRQAAYSDGLGAGAGGGGAGRGRGGSILYLHLSDKTLATGEGVVRVEGAGPFLAAQLAELVGHGQIIVRPVIDLNDRVSVDCYEIPDRIRERVKLMDPVEQFPYGTAETTFGTDLDHIEAYRSDGPPGQTNSDNLAPASRFHHRVKTLAHWKVWRLNGRAQEWTSPHGFKWRVDPNGTHRTDNQPSDDGDDDDAG